MLLCLLALIGIGRAFAQGEGYVCDGPYNYFAAVQCVASSGTCADTGFAYQGFDLDPDMQATFCAPGSGTCNYTEDIHACIYYYWATRNYLGVCSSRVCTAYIDIYVCPLQ